MIFNAGLFSFNIQNIEKGIRHILQVTITINQSRHEFSFNNNLHNYLCSRLLYHYETKSDLIIDKSTHETINVKQLINYNHTLPTATQIP